MMHFCVPILQLIIDSFMFEIVQVFQLKVSSTHLFLPSARLKFMTEKQYDLLKSTLCPE